MYRHLPVLFVAFATLLAIAAPAQAALNEGSCPGFHKPRVVINSSFVPPRYDYYQSLGKLRQIAEQDTNVVFHKEQPVGLAVGELAVGVNMTTQAVYGSDGQICAAPALINIDMGFRNNVVYVARELPRRSCAHEEVLNHEEEHVNIDRALLAEYKDRIQYYMQRAAEHLGTVRAADTAIAEQQLKEFMNSHLQRVAEEVNAERKKRQVAHDSAEEYKRLSSVCGSEVSKVVTAAAEKTDQDYQSIVKRSSYGAYASGNDPMTSPNPYSYRAPAPEEHETAAPQWHRYGQPQE